MLRQEVALAIEKAILLGTLAPGQRLVEADVASQMGISKAPVREALRSLEQLGLVVNRPRRGTFVTPVTGVLAGEAFSLRALLETYAGRLAVHAVQEEHLRQMRAYLEHAADVWDDYPARVEFDLRMHDVIFELSGHHLLQQAWGNLRSQVQLLLTVSGILRSEAYGRGQPTSMVAVHEPIMQALRDRDADRLDAAIIAHLAEGERRLRQALDHAGEPTGGQAPGAPGGPADDPSHHAPAEPQPSAFALSVRSELFARNGAAGEQAPSHVQERIHTRKHDHDREDST